MPREIITVSVGQCGNQVGWRFWEQAIAEHLQHSHGGFDDAMSTFFAEVPSTTSSDELRGLRLGPAGGPAVRARAILVDTEEGVVRQVLRSRLGPLFDSAQQIVTEVSGAGNNWAHGYCEYGPQTREPFLERVRWSLESCDSPQSFFLLHSLGGGTGSGLGSYLVEALAAEYPELYRISSAVAPSAECNDVITAPYNHILSLAHLAEFADCVLPVENSSLLGISEAIRKASPPGAAAGTAAASARAPTASSEFAAGPIGRRLVTASALTFCAAGGHTPLYSTSSAAATMTQAIGSRLSLAQAGRAPSMAAPAKPAAAGQQRVTPNGGEHSGAAAVASEFDDVLRIADDVLNAARGARTAAATHQRVTSSARMRSSNGAPAPSTLSASQQPLRQKAAASGPVVSSHSSSTSSKGAGSLIRDPRAPASHGNGTAGYTNGGGRLRGPLARGVAREPHEERGAGSAGSSGCDDAAADDDDAGADAEAGRRRRQRSGTAWDDVNNIIAHVLTHLTASMRFQGPLNVDLNELASTLVPFPRMHFLQSSISPLFLTEAEASQERSRRVDKLFVDAFSRGAQLTSGDPKRAVHMACGFLLRGDVPISDAMHNVARVRNELTMAPWNRDGFKIGLCSQPSVHAKTSLLTLSNNSSMGETFSTAVRRFDSLFSHRAHVHHYTAYGELEMLSNAADRVDELAQSYVALSGHRAAPQPHGAMRR